MSVVPGEPVPLKVSTTARTVALSVALVTASGERTVARRTGLPGHDWRSRLTIDPATHAVRANWPTAVELATTGFVPGIYVVHASDSNGTSSAAIVVVRTPVLDPTKPAFVYNAMTQAAYNRWGGYAFYRPLIATEVTFDRPLWKGGLGVWTRFDDKLVPWLLRQRPDLQFTTDYDLATNPPAVAPRALILGFHTEYVDPAMRDWVRLHVEKIGDMNLAIMGANSFYWRVRLGVENGSTGPAEMTCYKLDPRSDPLAAISPTGRYRDLRQPEGAMLGSQYSGVVFDGRRRGDLTITGAMPAELRTGTGWHAGTVLRGIVYGEGDTSYAGSGSVTIAAARGIRNPSGNPIAVGMVIRVTSSGGHVFDAGSFGFAGGLAPSGGALGVTPGSFDRFVRNVLTWLGVGSRR